MEADERAIMQRQIGEAMRLPTRDLLVLLGELARTTNEALQLYQALKGPMSVAGMQLPRELIFSHEMLQRSIDIFARELRRVTGAADGTNRSH